MIRIFKVIVLLVFAFFPVFVSAATDVCHKVPDDESVFLGTKGHFKTMNMSHPPAKIYESPLLPETAWSMDVETNLLKPVVLIVSNPLLCGHNKIRYHALLRYGNTTLLDNIQYVGFNHWEPIYIDGMNHIRISIKASHHR